MPRRVAVRHRQPPRDAVAPRGPGEAALRAALRRLGSHLRSGGQGTGPSTAASAPSPDPDPRDARQRPRASARPGTADPTRGGAQARRRAPDPRAWWPRLTPTQVQALLGAAITLALLLWDQIRQRLEGR
jgi:hypothetical protein